MLDPKLEATLAAFARTEQRLTALTGAGISAESGIPTFRGPEGYWTVGAKEYQPQEMATYAMFRRAPEEVWAWYLYRRGVCRRAEPNAGHLALVSLEERFGDRFTLITQNVDGLHLRAGSSPARTFQIHGHIEAMRCAKACSPDLYPLPDDLPPKTKGEGLTGADRERLRCPRCGEWARPHVLWFDEYYDEAYYRFDSSLRVAAQTGFLIVVGTSGATNLPNHIVRQVLQHGGLILNLDITENRFSELILASGRGYFLKQPSSLALPQVVAALTR